MRASEPLVLNKPVRAAEPQREEVAAMKETGRVEAFSDGVFAIAITLLVLELHPPEDGDLLAGLLAQWPAYVAYLISFLFILIMWINHHWIFQHIARVDSICLLLNGLLLLGITVLPFPTSIVSRYVLTDQAQVATAVYSGWFLIVGLLFHVLWRYASHGGRLLGTGSHDAGFAHVITARYRWGPAWYFLAFVLAFVWVPASLGLSLLLAIYYAVPREAQLRLPRSAAEKTLDTRNRLPRS
jgi:uncharacterized membrane protein